MVDYYHHLNFNAMVVQVRPASDAFYHSDSLPISRFLTGTEGYKRDWSEDPMEFLIEETHRLGMDFHAWINPYRATTDTLTTVLSQNHILRKKPEWIIPYGGRNYLNPGIPEVQAYLVGVVREIVTNYDVDGIHLDDYFYPYHVEGETYADSLSYRKFGKAFDSIDDWRRSNVDSLIAMLHREIKQIKPWVVFGISPFGVWRNKSNDPGGSETDALQTNYDHLYADPLVWAEQGWVDYLAPQLYWSMDYEKASYRVLANWWALKLQGVQLYIGIGAYKYRNNHDKAWYNSDEIPNQLLLNRQKSEIDGMIFFSAKSLIKERKLSKRLRRDHFPDKVLANYSEEPSQILSKPVVSVKLKRRLLECRTSMPDGAKSIIYIMEGPDGHQIADIVRVEHKKGLINLPNDAVYDRLLCVYQDRFGRVSKQTILATREDKQWRIQ